MGSLTRVMSNEEFDAASSQEISEHSNEYSQYDSRQKVNRAWYYIKLIRCKKLLKKASNLSETI